MQGCEGTTPDAPGSTLGVTEPLDAVDREKWLRCVLRHNASLLYIKELADKGYIKLPPLPL